MKSKRTINKKLVFKFLIFIFIWHNSSAQDSFAFKLAQAAESLTLQKVIYDPSYYSIDYPGGDIPSDKGVCTDVIIRAYRKLGSTCKRKYMKI